MSVTEVHTTGSPVRADGAPRDVGSEDAVAARLQALEGMTYDGLRTEWRRLYRAASSSSAAGPISTPFMSNSKLRQLRAPATSFKRLSSTRAW